jgi:hypothetical protein
VTRAAHVAGLESRVGDQRRVVNQASIAIDVVPAAAPSVLVRRAGAR